MAAPLAVAAPCHCTLPLTIVTPSSHVACAGVLFFFSYLLLPLLLLSVGWWRSAGRTPL